MNLLPYIYDQAMNSVNQQKPLMNALQIEYPKEDFQNCYDQFMFGESLLVAPVIEEKQLQGTCNSQKVVGQIFGRIRFMTEAQL